MINFFPQIKEQKAWISELRRHFHQYPERSLEEFKTAEKIEKELSGLGIPHKRAGETGVWGSIKGREGGKIMILRADTDALSIQEENDVPYRSKNPGVMHACGHDGHIASLLGAAKVLAANKNNFSGEVRLVFQQAEEIGAGAKHFIEEGVLEGAGRVFAVHMLPDADAGKIDLTSGSILASADYFRITVMGKSAHIATPHKGADALYAACQIVGALQGIVTKKTSPVSTVIIGVGTIQAGTAYNIIADEAVLEGTIRTLSTKLRDEVKNHVDEVSLHIAAASGTEREIYWRSHAPVLVNDVLACAEAAEIAKTIAGNDSVMINRPPSLGGDDFAEFLSLVPGVYANIGCAHPGKPHIALHNSCFDMNEDALLYAAGMYAGYALWYLDACLP